MDRLVETEQDRKMLVRFIEARKLPFVATIKGGRHRTLRQNQLQRLWMNEISEQLGDTTPEEARGYCKLAIGVPILRAENEDFCAAYDQHIKPLPYFTKIAMMMEPLDWPVTRLMTTKQHTEYLDAVYKHFTEQGVKLTVPDDGLMTSVKEAA